MNLDDNPSKEQLEQRWNTEEGKNILSNILNAISKGENWNTLTKELLFIEDVFNGKDLRGAIIKNATIKDSDFQKANLDYAQLKNVKFVNVDFTETFFFYSDIDKSSFRKCVFTESKMGRSNICDSIFSGCILNNTNFLGAKLANTNFVNSDLSNSMFVMAKTKNLQFFRTNLSDTIFENEDSALDKSNITLNTPINPYEDAKKFLWHPWADAETDEEIINEIKSLIDHSPISIIRGVKAIEMLLENPEDHDLNHLVAVEANQFLENSSKVESIKWLKETVTFVREILKEKGHEI